MLWVQAVSQPLRPCLPHTGQGTPKSCSSPSDPHPLVPKSSSQHTSPSSAQTLVERLRHSAGGEDGFYKPKRATCFGMQRRAWGSSRERTGGSQGQPGSHLCVMGRGDTSSGWDVPPSQGLRGARRARLRERREPTLTTPSGWAPTFPCLHPLHPWANGGTGEVPVDGTQ